ncbi:MAG: hypothetical protein ACTSVB_03260 [Candidatus Heimdallarchaeaceae archaeon]
MFLKWFRVENVLDSRGEKSIKVTVKNQNGKVSWASAPSGKSKGKHEVRDYSVSGFEKSVEYAKKILKELMHKKTRIETFEDLIKVEEIFRKYDKTKDMHIIGGNVLFCIEAALLKLVAASYNMELFEFLLEHDKRKKIKKIRMPMPVGNFIGGGMHVKKKFKSDFQEFLAIPNAETFLEAYKLNKEVYALAKSIVKKKDTKWRGDLTDEKAIASNLDNETILGIMNIIQGIIKEKSKSRLELRIGIDAAASSFYKKGRYYYNNFMPEKKEVSLSKEEQIEYMFEIAEKTGFFYMEDPLNEEDFDGFAELLKKIRRKRLKCIIVGDDLITTNSERLKKAIKKKSVNGIIIKPNQVGSLLKTKTCLDLAFKNKITPIISHRSGETFDTAISHLAVGWQISFIKCGIKGREREVKLKELIKIENLILNKY